MNKATLEKSMSSPDPSPKGMVRERKIVLILGAPGSGKGTMCYHFFLESSSTRAPIRDFLPENHISIGDMLRRLKDCPGRLSTEQLRKVEDGELLGGAEVVSLLKREMAELSQTGNNPGKALLIDGMPRNMDQLQAFKAQIGDPDLVISLQCPKEIALQRYLGRHVQTRPDGTEELFAKRFAEFEAENPKILETYKKDLPGRVIEVDIGSTKDSAYNFANLQTALKTHGFGQWF